MTAIARSFPKSFPGNPARFQFPAYRAGNGKREPFFRPVYL